MRSRPITSKRHEYGIKPSMADPVLSPVRGAGSRSSDRKENGSILKWQKLTNLYTKECCLKETSVGLLVMVLHMPPTHGQARHGVMTCVRADLDSPCCRRSRSKLGRVVPISDMTKLSFKHQSRTQQFLLPSNNVKIFVSTNCSASYWVLWLRWIDCYWIFSFPCFSSFVEGAAHARNSSWSVITF